MYEKKVLEVAEGQAHWWSGWPGAYCLKCGCDDPTEYAIGHFPVDFESGEIQFPTQEDYDKWLAGQVCPVKDDDSKHPWLAF